MALFVLAEILQRLQSWRQLLQVLLWLVVQSRLGAFISRDSVDRLHIQLLDLGLIQGRNRFDSGTLALHSGR